MPTNRCKQIQVLIFETVGYKIGQWPILETLNIHTYRICQVFLFLNKKIILPQLGTSKFHTNDSRVFSNTRNQSRTKVGVFVELFCWLARGAAIIIKVSMSNYSEFREPRNVRSTKIGKYVHDFLPPQINVVQRCAPSFRSPLVVEKSEAFFYWELKQKLDFNDGGILSWFFVFIWKVMQWALNLKKKRFELQSTD